MKHRFEKVISAKRKSGKKLFCAYITLGFPTLDFTRRIIPQLEENGVDILELGIPFSDPMADGPIIQDAAHVSLQKGTTVNDAFKLVHEMRSKGVMIPIVFFTYYNIIHAMGTKQFVAKVKQSGFDAVLCPDLPPEEDGGLSKLLNAQGISMIYLIAPTTTATRCAYLAKKSRGFIYYVSRKGVTGVQQSLDKHIAQNVKAIKKHTDTNILVGFGVSNAQQVRTIARVSDGVIVGSAIIDAIKKTKSVPKTLQFIKKISKGCK